MFDEIPGNMQESWPCPECENGNITEENYKFICDSCEFECDEDE